MNTLSRAITLCSLLLMAVSAFPTLADVPENHVRIHFQRSSGIYTDWGLHLWGRGLNLPRRITWSTPLLASGEDDFGAYYDVPIQPSAEEFGFIIHRGERKSVKQDLTFNLAENGREVWLYEGDPQLYSANDLASAITAPGAAAVPVAADPALMKQLNELLAQNKVLTAKVANYLSSQRESERYLSKLQQDNEQFQQQNQQLQLALDESSAHADSLQRQLTQSRQRSSDEQSSTTQLRLINEQLHTQISQLKAANSERETSLQQEINRLQSELQNALTFDGITSYFKRNWSSASTVDLQQGVFLTVFAVLLIVLVWFYLRMRRQWLLARQDLQTLRASQIAMDDPVDKREMPATQSDVKDKSPKQTDRVA